MAGGSGTRLWPLSRTQFPKQFLKLSVDGYTLLQSTVLRLKNLDCDDPILVCNEEHRFLAAEQMREIGINATIILEPVGKNTAPAIALAAFLLKQKAENKLMLVLAADHIIADQALFERSVIDAVYLAEQRKLVAFGIVPTHAEIGYGYIEKGLPIEHGFNIARFIEKPDQVTAQEYLESQKFLWNSGMFMLDVEQYLEELKKYASDIFQACYLSMQDTQLDFDFIRINKLEFEKCRSESIDYAVMEKTKEAVVIPLKSGWSDIGSWSALWDIRQKDQEGNVIDGDVILHQSKIIIVIARAA
jgi:mannose-1-phosphate guanylyltransferase/mannose-1-phosphate guanylyltransferase/mannose-6-phosphate isomerase